MRNDSSLKSHKMAKEKATKDNIFSFSQVVNFPKTAKSIFPLLSSPAVRQYYCMTSSCDPSQKKKKNKKGEKKRKHI